MASVVMSPGRIRVTAPQGGGQNTQDGEGNSEYDVALRFALFPALTASVDLKTFRDVEEIIPNQGQRAFTHAADR